MAEETWEQRFGPTSGQATGWLGVAIFGFFVVYLAAIERDVETAALLAAVVVLVWCFLLRPRILLRPDVLVLRNAFSDWQIPLTRVEDVVVRQVTLVDVGDQTCQGIGVGRPLRRLVREHPGRQPIDEKADRPTARAGSLTSAQVPDFMVQQVLERAAMAPAPADGEQVSRTYAVPELAAVAVLLGVFLVLAAL